MEKNYFRRPDATPEEIRLVEKRLKLKQALRAEYVKKYTSPYNSDPHHFDPAMQRYYSMHQTLYDNFVPTMKGFARFMAITIIPIFLYAKLLRYTRDKYDMKCRNGELEYKDRVFKVI